ncbi:CHAT domain-containing protein [Aquimarina aquimarini]|uniref:CHAT domain-containing protein n=3 Tax=Aquimarina aquimarini TaxID=1191734 RepID=UPI001F2AEB60|nr:CHAT domain-containing tetratricopeptide repeat protein [Aquimarina aquimarini]
MNNIESAYHIRITLIIVFLASSYFSYAQITKDTIVASQNYKKAESLLLDRKVDSSIAYYNKALVLYKEAHAWEKVAVCYNRISFSLWETSQLKKSLQQSEKALAICKTYLTKDHRVEAYTYDNIGQYHKSNSDYDKSIEYFEKALSIRRKLFSEDHSELAVSYTNIGSIYYYTSKYEKAVQYFKKTLAIDLKILGPEHYEIGGSYNNIAVIYDELGEFNKALEYYKKNLRLAIKKFGEDSDNITRIYNNIAVTYINLKQYDIALDHCNKALAVIDKKNNPPSLINIYNNIGIILKNKGENDKAIQFCKKGLDIIHKLGEKQDLKTGSFYINLGTIYKQKGQLKKALEYQKKALQKLALISGGNHYKVTQVYDNIGSVLSAQNREGEALEYYKKVLKMRKNIFAEDNNEIAITYQNIADTYVQMQKYDDALFYYKKGLEIVQTIYGKEHNLTSEFYYSYGVLYHKQQKYSKALEYFDKALLSASKNIETKVKKEFTDQSNYSDPKLLLQILSEKAKTLKSKFSHSNNPKDLNKAIGTYQKATTIINTIRQGLTNYQDKVAFAKIAKDIYKEAIATQLLLYAKNKDQASLEKAFYYAEISKANTLKELLADANAKNFTGLPNDLLELEKELRINRSFYRSKITEEQVKKESDTAKITRYENHLFEVNRRQDSLTQILEKKHPKYYQLKYKKNIVTASDIQRQLDDKTSLLEFFTADSITYAFAIAKNSIAVQELTTPKLTQQIEKFRASITEKNTLTFKQQAHELYLQLIAPIVDQCIGDQLIIIPDGSLWHLNFELLLSKKDASNNPALLSYLLRDYAITYANAANLLFTPFRDKQKDAPLQECLAFSFSDSTQTTENATMRLASLRDAGGDLPGTRKEIRAISEIIDGQYYFGSQAIEANFKNNANKYNILHLALHGEVDNEHPEYSKLYFTKNKDTIEDNLLYGHELFALDIPAELTVLSACNTGTGKIAKGEGIMSLGNAFQYAGTKSLLLTSWEVSDQTTPELMKYFYTYLKSGMNKGKALQQAKLQYLATANINRTAPFYWAGFYLVGDTTPMHFEQRTVWYWVLAVLVLILISTWFWYRKKYKI